VDDFDVLTEKGVYPYSYMSSLDKFEETELPPIECFYNDLGEEACPQDMYKRAQDVWDRFTLDTLGDYHDIYLLTDVGLLSDVFENFRDLCVQYYCLDPAHYLTLPHFAWDAMLRTTGVSLKLITHIGVVNMVEGGKREACAKSQKDTQKLTTNTQKSLTLRSPQAT
jgi:hypothetical protein